MFRFASLFSFCRRIPTVLWLIGLAVVAFVPGLGVFGFWDPWELSLADRALAIAKGPSAWDVTAGGQFGPLPPVELLLSALSIRLLGASEWAARAPVLFLGLATVVATYWAAVGLMRKRAAVMSVVVLITTPLFFLQSRQITSDMALILSLALSCGGFGRYFWATAPANEDAAGHRHRLRLRKHAPLALAAGGLGLGFFSGGGVLGVAVPCLAAGGAFFLTRRDGAGAATSPASQPASGPSASFLPAGLLLLAACALVAAAVWANQAGVFSFWLGGVRRAIPGSERFSFFIRQLGFGLFPWGAIGVLSLGAVFGVSGGLGVWATSRSTREVDADARDTRRAAGLSAFLLLFFGLSFAASTVLLWASGALRFAALVPLALATGRFFDGVLVSRQPRPVFGGLAAIGTLLVARDIWLIPADLLSVHLLAELKWPPHLKAGPLSLLVGVLVSAGVYWICAFSGEAAEVSDQPTGDQPDSDHAAGSGKPGGAEPKRRVSRWILKSCVWASAQLRRYRNFGMVVVSGTAFAFALVVNHSLVPELSGHFSFKPVFSSFARHSKPGDGLGRYRVDGHGAAFYGADGMEELRTQDELMAFFERDTRVFTLANTTDLAVLDAAFKTAKKPYFVVDSSSNRFLLLSNELGPAEIDVNPLRKNVWLAPEAPVEISESSSPGKRLYKWPEQKPDWSFNPITPVVFGDAIELIGTDIPRKVRRPSKVPITLVFRVLKRPPPGYKIFLHIDLPSEPRVIGDHDPLEGAFPTAHWLAGEYIRDVHSVTFSSVTNGSGTYKLYVGFWPGGNGARLPITDGTNDGSDRAYIGTMTVK